MGIAEGGFAVPRIVHLDHTTVRGGAEMALVRLLSAEPPWSGDVLVPSTDGDDVFGSLPSSAHQWVRGVKQTAGGSTGSVFKAFDLGLRLLTQAVLTRSHPAVRHCDLVVANTTRAAAYAAIALQQSSKPLVVHLRDQVTIESLGVFGFRLMTKLVLPRADGIIANSHSTLATASPYIRRDALARVIPSPAGLRTLRRVEHVQSALRVGMLARVDPWKGQMLLLEAFAQAFPGGTERLEIAGGSPFFHDDFAVELQTRARVLGIGDRVSFLGYVDDVVSLLSRWDVAVQSSLRPEPLGQNVLQYLAAGTATIVADEGGPAEWVHHDVNGLRVHPRDVAALATALRELAADPAKRRRLGAAAQRTAGLLDDHSIAQAHAQAYGDVLRQAGGAGRIAMSVVSPIVAAA